MMPGESPYRIYRQQQVSGLSTEKLLLLAMDTAVRACRQRRRGLLVQVLHELMAGLDLSGGEVAGNLLTLYEYLLRLTREGRLEEAQAMLEELRETWSRALNAEAGRAAVGSSPYAGNGEPAVNLISTEG
ncbi:MAG: flagellar protein FliS [Candidatus Eisenbacteria bacterium]|nr:flagellar protein FliS [Candidatus Eisenbacteria bacterium]